ncbi:MAG TPA: hypothetical protein VN793_04740, partial [Acidimicrobiales bacterium]|nr:hypothetical protein [Acidimicrobiales bacterium]
HDEPEEFGEAVARLLVDQDEWVAQRDRIMGLHRIWEEIGARRPRWTEIIECALEHRSAPCAVPPMESAHVG